jgi:hypothetical protein
MESWLELGLLVHVVLGIVSGTAILLTALAVVRSPRAEAGTAGRPPEAAAAHHDGGVDRRDRVDLALAPRSAMPWTL